MYIITMDVCIRLGVLKKDEKYSPDDTKTKVIFVIGQWVYMLVEGILENFSYSIF